MVIEPGKYDNIPLSEYHKLHGWSKTALDKIEQSPAHYSDWIANPPEQTPAMAFGSALHCAILTPELYKKSYVASPPIDRRTKAGKEAWEEFKTEMGDKNIISPQDCGNVERMYDAIFNHPLASQILSNGEAEQSFLWIDPKTELNCKARSDYLRKDNICIDLKTCEDARFKPFQRSIYNYRYHVQGAFYMDGIFQATGRQCSDFVIIAIEKESPYGIMIYRLDELALDTGRLSYKENLNTIKEWKTKPELYNTVYPISNNPIEISLPAWAD